MKWNQVQVAEEKERRLHHAKRFLCLCLIFCDILNATKKQWKHQRITFSLQRAYMRLKTSSHTDGLCHLHYKADICSSAHAVFYGQKTISTSSWSNLSNKSNNMIVTVIWVLILVACSKYWRCYISHQAQIITVFTSHEAAALISEESRLWGDRGPKRVEVSVK